MHFLLGKHRFLIKQRFGTEHGLEGVLGLSWVSFGSSLGLLGRPFRPPGNSWSGQERPKNVSRTVLEVSWHASWSHVGSPWPPGVLLGPFWGLLGACREPLRGHVGATLDTCDALEAHRSRTNRHKHTHGTYGSHGSWWLMWLRVALHTSTHKHPGAHRSTQMHTYSHIITHKHTHTYTNTHRHTHGTYGSHGP